VDDTFEVFTELNSNKGTYTISLTYEDVTSCPGPTFPTPINFELTILPFNHPPEVDHVSN